MQHVFTLLTQSNGLSFSNVHLHVVSAMGASESTMAASDSLANLDESQPKYLFKLYSKQFETDEEEVPDEVDTTNLYLDDYGEDDDQPDEEKAPVESPDTPSALSPEDEDYPIDTMNANLAGPPEAAPVDTEAAGESQAAHAEQRMEQPDAGAAYESARDAKADELATKYPPMPNRTSVCENERSSLMRCYKENDDMLNCRDAVLAYSQCAKAASSEALSRRN